MPYCKKNGGGNPCCYVDGTSDDGANCPPDNSQYRFKTKNDIGFGVYCDDEDGNYETDCNPYSGWYRTGEPVYNYDEKFYADLNKSVDGRNKTSYCWNSSAPSRRYFSSDTGPTWMNGKPSGYDPSKIKEGAARAGDCQWPRISVSNISADDLQAWDDGKNKAKAHWQCSDYLDNNCDYGGGHKPALEDHSPEQGIDTEGGRGFVPGYKKKALHKEFLRRRAIADPNSVVNQRIQGTRDYFNELGDNLINALISGTSEDLQMAIDDSKNALKKMDKRLPRVAADSINLKTRGTCKDRTNAAGIPCMWDPEIIDEHNKEEGVFSRGCKIINIVALIIKIGNINNKKKKNLSEEEIQNNRIVASVIFDSIRRQCRSGHTDGKKKQLCDMLNSGAYNLFSLLESSARSILRDVGEVNLNEDETKQLIEWAVINNVKNLTRYIDITFASAYDYVVMNQGRQIVTDRSSFIRQSETAGPWGDAEFDESKFEKMIKDKIPKNKFMVPFGMDGGMDMPTSFM